MLNKLKHSPNLKIDTQKDWKIICGIFLVLVVLVLISDIYFFYVRNGLDSYAAATQDIATILDKTRLTNTVEEWKAKEVKFNKVLGEREVLVDPSL